MSFEIIVCVKQVIDPEMPTSLFKIDSDTKKVVDSPGVAPIINGFDDNAVEAALQIKDQSGANVTILSLGSHFALDVMKKPLAMGSDQLILLQDDSFDNLDAYSTAFALSKGIQKIGSYDLILCGRQASDWDNAQVPQGIAEFLDISCVTTAQKIDISDNSLVVSRVLNDGIEIVQADLPALISVSNELGEPRYANLKGIMAAARKVPTVWTADDIGLEAGGLLPKVSVTDLSLPQKDEICEFIEGQDESEIGKELAIRLRQEKLI